MKLKILCLAVTTESNVNRKWLSTFEKSVSPVEPGLADAIIWDFVWRLQTSKKSVKLQWSLQEWGRPLNTAGGRKLFEAVASHCFRLEAQRRSLRRPLSELTLVSGVSLLHSQQLLTTEYCRLCRGRLEYTPCYYRVSYQSVRFIEYLCG